MPFLFLFCHKRWKIKFSKTKENSNQHGTKNQRKKNLNGTKLNKTECKNLQQKLNEKGKPPKRVRGAQKPHFESYTRTRALTQSHRNETKRKESNNIITERKQPQIKRIYTVISINQIEDARKTQK